MARKIGLHTDAIAVIVLIFLLSLGMNLYQRYQYSNLLQENVNLQWDLQNATINVKLTQGQIKRCLEKLPAPALPSTIPAPVPAPAL